MRAKRKKLLTNEKFCGIIYMLSENGTQNGSLAQLGEHLPYKQRVSGSSPLTSTNMEAPTKVGAFSFVYPLLISFLTAEFVRSEERR